LLPHVLSIMCRPQHWSYWDSTCLTWALCHGVYYIWATGNNIHLSKRIQSGKLCLFKRPSCLMFIKHLPRAVSHTMLVLKTTAQCTFHIVFLTSPVHSIKMLLRFTCHACISLRAWFFLLIEFFPSNQVTSTIHVSKEPAAKFIQTPLIPSIYLSIQNRILYKYNTARTGNW